METEYGFEIQALDAGFYFVSFGTGYFIPVLLTQFTQIVMLTLPLHCGAMTKTEHILEAMRRIFTKLPLWYLSCSTSKTNGIAYLALLVQALPVSVFT